MSLTAKSKTDWKIVIALFDGVYLEQSEKLNVTFHLGNDIRGAVFSI